MFQPLLSILALLFFMLPSDMQGVEGMKIRFEIPNDFHRIQNEDGREVYQNESGVMFGYSIGRTLETDEDVGIVAAMSANVFANTLNEFNLIYHDNATQINDMNYVVIIYSCLNEGQSTYNSMFLTRANGKLVTFTFACPLETAEGQINLLEDILSSVVFIKT